MSDMQNILAALIAAIKERRITVDVAEAAVRMLDGVPDYSHLDAIKALLRTPSSDEEHPEDYLAVKTFASNEFHVGDEVEFNGAYGRKRGVVLAVNGEKINILKGVVLSFGIVFHAVMGDGSAGEWDEDTDGWHRTGRNFPAIPAILDELKRLDKSPLDERGM